MLSDPLFSAPLARLYVLVVKVDVSAFELPDDIGSDFASAVAMGYDSDGRMRGPSDCDDLDDHLCRDVLAFCIASHDGQRSPAGSPARTRHPRYRRAAWLAPARSTRRIPGTYRESRRTSRAVDSAAPHARAGSTLT